MWVMDQAREAYPSDVSDEEWAFVARYLTLMREDAPQREYSLREVFNALRWVIKTGAQWRALPHDFPPWPVVYNQARRWAAARVFEPMVHDLRVVLRVQKGRAPDPTAAVLDSRTLQSTPESGARAGYDGAKKRKGSKVHAAVDTLGDLLALQVTPANKQDRAQVYPLLEDAQKATHHSLQAAFVDQGYTGEEAAADAKAVGVRLIVIRHPETKRGFILLPRRWVVERFFAWTARFRRLARDYERLAQTLAAWHWMAFASLLLNQMFP